MENKLLCVPQLVHRDQDHEKGHMIVSLEAENGDSMEWKTQKGTSPTKTTTEHIVPLHKDIKGKTVTKWDHTSM